MKIKDEGILIEGIYIVGNRTSEKWVYDVEFKDKNQKMFAVFGFCVNNKSGSFFYQGVDLDDEDINYLKGIAVSYASRNCSQMN